MDFEKAKSLSIERLKTIYKYHLEAQGLGRNTVGTVIGDTFYLWNNVNENVFWETVTADDFEEKARVELFNALTQNSSGNVTSLISGYVSKLRKFREFILSLDELYDEVDDYTAIKDFLLDIDCLEPLTKWTSQFNLFDVLKITRVEIRHSNMLSWLLNPNENHGLNDSVLRGFIQFAVTYFSDETEIFDTLLMDLHDFVIQREWHNIDILSVSADEKFVLCIENKIDSKEHSNQLNRYRKIIEETYPTYKVVYIYLSPDGTESSDPENWYSMSYSDVLQIIEKACNSTKLLPDTELLIKNYIDTIRRDIVGDENLARVCAEIYAKHQKALDLIFENRPDRASELASIFRKWAQIMNDKGEIIFSPEKSVKSYTRFKTQTMSRFLPDVEGLRSGWNTPNFYFYEIRNNGNDFFIQLALSSRNIPDDLRKVCEQINKYFPARTKKVDWQWRTPFSTKHIKVEEEFSEEYICEQLNRLFENVKKFELKLTESLDKDIE